MTKFEKRKTTLLLVMSNKGGVRKTTTVAYLADILRETSASVGILDGDLKIHGTYQRFAELDDQGQFLENQSLTSGAWISDLRDVKGRAKILEAIEQEPDFLIVDSAGGADDNFGDIFGDGFEPSDFIETLTDMDARVVFVCPVLPDDDDTIRSVKTIAKSFEGLPVFFLIVLSGWAASGDADDSRYSLWMGSKVRQSLVDSGNFAELKVNNLPDEIMVTVRETPAPFSKIVDQTAINPKKGEKYSINIWTRQSLKKVRASIQRQMAAVPALKEIFGL
jgi:hypothetical protein